MRGTSSAYLSSPLVDASPSTYSFRYWNSAMTSSAPPTSSPTQGLCAQAPAPVVQITAPKRNPRRAIRDKGTENKKIRSTPSASPTKGVRNRNNVLIVCEPCKGVRFTRTCIYKAHLKSKRHGRNVAEWDAKSKGEKYAPAPCVLATSAPFSIPDSGFLVATFDYTLFDFDNLDYGLLDSNSSGTSASDCGDQVSENSTYLSLEELWNTPAPVLEVPAQATLSIVGGSLAAHQDCSRSFNLDKDILPPL